MRRSLAHGATSLALWTRRSICVQPVANFWIAGLFGLNGLKRRTRVCCPLGSAKPTPVLPSLGPEEIRRPEDKEAWGDLLKHGDIAADLKRRRGTTRLSLATFASFTILP